MNLSMTSGRLATLIVGGNEKNRLSKARKMTKGAVSGDFLLLEPNPSIGIDDVRRLTSFVHLTPLRSSGKGVVIREAQTMTLEAQNAALKTLEEFPADVRLILTAPAPELLLPTIVSRCQILSLGPMESTDDEPELARQAVELKQALLAGLPACFGLAQRYSRSPQHALSWLTNIELFWRHKLLESLDRPKKWWLSQAIRAADKTRILIIGNVNAKLALETFLLKLLRLRYTKGS
jgi:hypothetical protein